MCVYQEFILISSFPDHDCSLFQPSLPRSLISFLLKAPIILKFIYFFTPASISNQALRMVSPLQASGLLAPAHHTQSAPARSGLASPLCWPCLPSHTTQLLVCRQGVDAAPDFVTSVFALLQAQHLLSSFIRMRECSRHGFLPLSLLHGCTWPAEPSVTPQPSLAGSSICVTCGGAPCTGELCLLSYLCLEQICQWCSNCVCFIRTPTCGLINNLKNAFVFCLLMLLFPFTFYRFVIFSIIGSGTQSIHPNPFTFLRYPFNAIIFLSSSVFIVFIMLTF